MVDTTAFLVAPVCGDTMFGELVHLVRADLHFNGLAARTVHGCMQGLVAVFLGIGDVIIEFMFDMAPLAMHQAKHLVAVCNRIDKDADGAHIEQFMKVPLLRCHLFPDAVDMFRAAVYFRFYARLFNCLLEHIDHVMDELLPAVTRFFKIFGDTLVSRRFQVPE